MDWRVSQVLVQEGGGQDPLQRRPRKSTARYKTMGEVRLDERKTKPNGLPNTAKTPNFILLTQKEQSYLVILVTIQRPRRPGPRISGRWTKNLKILSNPKNENYGGRPDTASKSVAVRSGLNYYRAPLRIQYSKLTILINQWLRSEQSLEIAIIRSALQLNPRHLHTPGMRYQF